MIQANNTTVSIPYSVAEHMSKQLVSLQRAMDKRGDDNCHPSAPELSMQTKIITNISRIKKLNAVDEVANAMNAFLRFAGKQNKQAAKIIADLYLQFKGVELTDATTQPAESTSEAARKTETALPLSASALSSDVLPRPATTPSSNFALSLSGAHSQSPLTDNEYNCCKLYMLDVNHGHKDDMLNIDGRTMNKGWLEYTLYQHTLPEHDRKFIPTQEEYYQTIDHNDTVEKINRFIMFG